MTESGHIVGWQNGPDLKKTHYGDWQIGYHKVYFDPSKRKLN